MTEKVTKDELIAEIAESLGEPKSKVAEVINSYHKKISANLVAGREYSVQGLFSVKQVVREARTARNPQNGEAIEIPRHNDLKIKLSDGLRKERANS